MEESVADLPNKISFTSLFFNLTADGTVSIIMAISVSVFILAVAWRLVMNKH